MKDKLTKPCSDCPFRRVALRGWLGAYEGPEDFIASHHGLDLQNPCHLGVDYSDADWLAKLDDAPACIGQQVMYLNECKLPRTWKIPESVEADRDGVFNNASEFVAYHRGDKLAPCHFCNKPVDADDTKCHGCGEHVCDTCEQNHTLMGQHDVTEHLIEPDLDDDGGDW